MRSVSILAGLLAAALGSNGLLAAERILSGEEVRALFSGKTVDYRHLTLGFSLSVYYAADGSMRGMRDGNKSTRGTWHVNDKGELCIEYGKGDRCRHIVEMDGEYRKYKEQDGKQVHIVTYDRFTAGNPNNY